MVTIEQVEEEIELVLQHLKEIKKRITEGTSGD